MNNQPKNREEILATFLTKPEGLHLSIGLEMIYAVTSKKFSKQQLLDAFWKDHEANVRDQLEALGDDFARDDQGGIFITDLGKMLVVDVYKSPDWIRFTELMLDVEYKHWEAGIIASNKAAGVDLHIIDMDGGASARDNGNAYIQ